MRNYKVLIMSGSRGGMKGHIKPLLARIERLFPDNNIDFSISALANLDFYIDGKNTYIRDIKQGFDVSDFDLVVFRTVGNYKEEAMATAIYLEHKSKRFIDKKYPIVSGRLGSTMDRWTVGLAIPHTAYGTSNGLLLALDNIGLPAILKATNSRKGQDNYLIKSKAELKEKLEKNQDLKFVLQQFIPNNGDYRVLVMGGRRVVVSLRQGRGDTHLNNVSAGGTETLVDSDTVPEVVKLARRAAKRENLQIAGVDIIVDKNNGEPYILEVNRAPNMTIDAEAESFQELIENILNTKRIFNKPTDTIGRRTTAKLPGLGVRQIVAKIDTGAYSTALHAENIRLENDILKFDIMPSEFVATKSGNVEHCEFADYFIQKVRSSNGRVENRYSIKTRMSIGRRVVVGTFTLSDRSNMGYPLLIGRKIIRSRFLVNVELDENRKKTWRY